MDPRSVRCVAWSKAEPFGAEFAEVQIHRDALIARGVSIGIAPSSYRLDYELETASGFVTTRLLVTARGHGWMRSLDLRRASSGVWEEIWSEDGENPLLPRRTATDLGALGGALDVDLGLSPLLNTPPVLRHSLARQGGSADFVMAWVSVPDLRVHRSPPRYTFLRTIDDERSLVRFESLAEDGFRADITYDAEGFVLDYPDIGTRIDAVGERFDHRALAGLGSFGGHRTGIDAPCGSGKERREGLRANGSVDPPLRLDGLRGASDGQGAPVLTPRTDSNRTTHSKASGSG